MKQMFFVFNETLGQIGRVSELPRTLKNKTVVQIGPSWNNSHAPIAYASDDLKDFQREMYRRGKAGAAELAGTFEKTDFVGWSE